MKAMLLGWIMLAFSIPHAVLAETTKPLEAPEGPVILTVDGGIGATNAEQQAQFDHEMLLALPQHSFTTGTPWTEGKSHYRGPLMRTLLEFLESEGDTVNVAALNGYEAEIPISDFYDYDVILALERDDQAIPIREYGPLWVLYPFDHDEALLSERMRFRAVWQVMHINVRQ